MSDNQRRVAVVGGGLAGVCAARAAFDAGHDVTIFDVAESLGGTSVLSQGWIWRYRDSDTALMCAPRANHTIAQSINERLDDDLQWLAEKGATVIAPETLNPLTVGQQLDIAASIDALAAPIGDDAIRLRHRALDLSVTESGYCLHGEIYSHFPAPNPRMWSSEFDAVIVATGGFASNHQLLSEASHLEAEQVQSWMPRNSGFSKGDLVAPLKKLGATWLAEQGESFMRLMPAEIEPSPANWAQWAQLHGAHGVLIDGRGSVVSQQPHDWAESLLAWQIARSGGTGWWLLSAEGLASNTPYGTRSQITRDIDAAGCPVITTARGKAAAAIESRTGVSISPQALKLVAEATTAIPVVAAITHTNGGFVTDEHGRVMSIQRNRIRRTRTAIPNIFAAGCDIHGAALGGYASGLAQAVVFGRSAGNSISISTL